MVLAKLPIVSGRAGAKGFLISAPKDFLLHPEVRSWAVSEQQKLARCMLRLECRVVGMADTLRVRL